MTLLPGEELPELEVANGVISNAPERLDELLNAGTDG